MDHATKENVPALSFVLVKSRGYRGRYKNTCRMGWERLEQGVEEKKSGELFEFLLSFGYPFFSLSDK
jgi:hypothetical protein